MANKLFVLILLSVLISCTGQEKSNPDYALVIKKTLATWNLDATVNQSVFEDTLKIDIFYWDFMDYEYKRKYYLDHHSNELIVKTLAFLNQDLFAKYSVVYFTLRFEGASDIGKFPIDSEKMRIIKAYFSNPLILENTVYSLESFTYNDIVVFDTMIKNLTEEVEEIDFEKNYWEMVRGFSLYCSENNKQYIEDALALILIDGYLFYEDFETEPKNADNILLSMLNKCGIQKEILEKSIDEIKKELGSR